MIRLWALLALIVIVVVWAGAVLVVGGVNRRACARAGYPRTINVGYVWPDVRCVKRGLLGQDEVVKL